jgi:hypothetical protein
VPIAAANGEGRFGREPAREMARMQGNSGRLQRGLSCLWEEMSQNWTRRNQAALATAAFLINLAPLVLR